MANTVLLIEGEEGQDRSLCALVQQNGYEVLRLPPSARMEQAALAGRYQVVIIDLDLVPWGNLELRELKRANPGADLLAVSSRPFHPELTEAMQKHIDVCLGKPVDPEELGYWLRSFQKNHQQA